MTDLHIHFDREQPPSGRIVLDDEAVPFDGWLSLLRCMEDALGDASPASQLTSWGPSSNSRGVDDANAARAT